MQRSIAVLTCALALWTTGLAGQADLTGPTVQGFIFGDVLYASVEGTDPGFRVGQMVAHANGTLSEHVLFFGELSATYRNSAYSVAMERAILRYEFNDAVKLSAGRYHTPISYWNTAFHHGLWLQGSVARPRAVTFGTPFIPVHFVGAMAEGRIPGTPVHYMGGVGNGRDSSGRGAQDGGDANGNRAVIVSTSIRPSTLSGLRIGGGVYLDRVPDGGAGESDERILSGHVVWDRGMMDVVAEYIDVAHEPTLGGTSRGSSAAYVHVGVRLPGSLRDLTPYGRWENMEVDSADPVFGSVLPDYDAIIGGVRYDLEGLAALTAEYRNEKFDGGASANSFVMQASFAIAVGGQS